MNEETLNKIRRDNVNVRCFVWAPAVLTAWVSFLAYGWCAATGLVGVKVWPFLVFFAAALFAGGILMQDEIAFRVNLGLVAAAAVSILSWLGLLSFAWLAVVGALAPRWWGFVLFFVVALLATGYFRSEYHED